VGSGLRLDIDAKVPWPKIRQGGSYRRIFRGIGIGIVCEPAFSFSTAGSPVFAGDGGSVRSDGYRKVCQASQGALMLLMEELFSNANITVMGFVFWLAISPNVLKSRDNGKYPAYMIALYLCLTISSDVMQVLPTAFFFSVGGGLAFCYMFARLMIRALFGK